MVKKSPMKLVLYSRGGSSLDLSLDAKVAEIVGKNGVISYIPSSSGPTAEKYFAAMQNFYRPFGITNFNYFPVDTDFCSSDLNRAMSSNAIFLSGGNTFSFLNILRKKAMLQQLTEYAQKGGCLIGQSAGAIITTPTIAVAGKLSGGGDENSAELTDLTGLNLVNFEFAPHHEKHSSELLEYSLHINRPIYACPDGSGISVLDSAITIHGPATCYFRGNSFDF